MPRAHEMPKQPSAATTPGSRAKTHIKRSNTVIFLSAVATVSLLMATVGRINASATAGGWGTENSPNTSPSQANYLLSVNCPAVSQCWAAGTANNQTLVEQNSGSGWSIVSSPNAGSSQNGLESITCPTVIDCWAVGDYYDAGNAQTLIEQWNGSGWTIVSSPNVSPFDALTGVTCSDSSDCWAVGYSQDYQIGGGSPKTLTEQWNGSNWLIVSSPNTGPSEPNYLFSVTCPAVNQCWAAGTANNQTLVEQNTGSGWSIVTSPNAGSSQNVLQSITCPTAIECWAVGYYQGAQGFDTLVEQNTGSGWSIVSSPNTGPSDQDSLQGVTCADANDCWAVGLAEPAGIPEPLIEQWNGSVWSIVTSPSFPSSGGLLLSATCVTTSRCWAVGDLGHNPCCVNQTLIEQYAANPTDTATEPEAQQIGLAASNVDTATVSSADASGSPTGTVTFFACGPLTSAQGCVSGGTVIGGPVSLSPSGPNVAIASSPTFTPTAPGTWCYRAYYSGDGNNGASYDGSASECFSVIAQTTFQDSSPSLAYDSWHGVADPTANGGTYRASATKGATATFKFSGSGITWITRKGPSQGIASVTIDGKKKGNVDLYATTSHSFSRGYSGLTSKKHTIVITVTGTRNALSGSTNVAIDAFIVGFTTTQDSSPSVTYDAWSGATSTSASGGTYRVSPKAGTTSSLSFTGSRVDWITATGPSAGKASVTIDGLSKGTVDLYASAVHWQVAESYGGLAPGSHTIIVTVLGTKNASSTGTQIVVDAFVVHS